MAKKFLVSPGRCYVVTGPVGTTITAKDGTVVNSIVTGSTQCSFIPSVNEVTVDPDTAKLEQVSRGIAVRSSNNGGGGGGGSTGNDWITVNDAGEAVLNFPEDRDLPIKFAYSGFTKVTGTTGGKIDCGYLFYACVNLTSCNLSLPEAGNANYVLKNATSLKYIKFRAPKAYNVGGAIPSNVIDFSFDLSHLQTVKFTSPDGRTNIGNLTALENVTVLDGGLASCTSFIITNSTNLTDASIQNIIDALPDYSGTETSALVSFPPDRLTTEQQAQLTSKGWTWS